jgi:hypothetical protein
MTDNKAPDTQPRVVPSLILCAYAEPNILGANRHAIANTFVRSFWFCVLQLTLNCSQLLLS